MTRRAFLIKAGLAGLMIPGSPPGGIFAKPPGARKWLIGVFSKVYQELNLSFEETAEVTAAAGLNGIDCPVRPGGQILPERVADDLPRLAEVLKKHNLNVLLLTTAIQSSNTLHAEAILKTMRSLGIKFYRLGYWNYTKDKLPSTQLADIKAQLKDLAALNKDLGVCAILQNHSGDNFVGANVTDNYELAREFDPREIAIAFDIGHAMNQLNGGWREVFKKLGTHLGVVYVKDLKRGAGFVPIGQGAIANSNFFELLKNTTYNAPISMHVEYDWSDHGANQTKARLIRVLHRDSEVLKRWLK